MTDYSGRQGYDPNLDRNFNNAVIYPEQTNRPIGSYLNPTSVKYRQTNNTNSKCRSCSRCLCIFGIILFILIVIAAAVIIALFAFYPCRFTKCHRLASTCINHRFRAECVCNDGLQGDGIEFCEGNFSLIIGR
jgi:hypothetical protein